MGRPRLPLGTAGEIRTYPVKKVVNGVEKTNAYRAVCEYRDFDGKVRPIERSGKTEAKARANLREAIRDRRRPNSGRGEITAESKLKEVGRFYLKKIEADVEAGTKSPGTYDTYRPYQDSLSTSGSNTSRGPRTHCLWAGVAQPETE